jgi:hypothetical protein
LRNANDNGGHRGQRCIEIPKNHFKLGNDIGDHESHHQQHVYYYPSQIADTKEGVRFDYRKIPFV